MKKVYFMAGLPRAGSTLLCNILGQNPDIEVGPSSGLLDLLLSVRASFEDNAFFKSMPEDTLKEKRLNVQKGIINSYFNMTQPVALDKNRGWVSNLEMAATLFGKDNVKAILCVRDLRDVLASFEKLYRKRDGLVPQARNNPAMSRTAIDRAKMFMDIKEPVGYAFHAIKDAITRGWKDNLHFVEFDSFTKKPEKAIQDIYNFLDVESYTHVFDKVKQITVENDRVHGFGDLHTIRPKVEPMEPSWPKVYDNTVFSTQYWKYLESEALFWRSLK